MNQISTAPIRITDPFPRQASAADASHDPQWLAARAALERDFPYGCPSYRFFSVLEAALRAGLKASGLYGRGKRNALDLRLTEIEIPFPHLPEAFDAIASCRSAIFTSADWTGSTTWRWNWSAGSTPTSPS